MLLVRVHNLLMETVAHLGLLRVDGHVLGIGVSDPKVEGWKSVVLTVAPLQNKKHTLNDGNGTYASPSASPMDVSPSLEVANLNRNIAEDDISILQPRTLTFTPNRMLGGGGPEGEDSNLLRRSIKRAC